MNYVLHILIFIGVYLLLAYSLNLIIGFGNLISLCHAGFYGIGAYIFTLVSIHWNLSFIPSLCIAIFFTGLIAFLIGIPAMRFRGDMFVVVTLGFQIIIFTILYNWVSLTKGPYGIPGIPNPAICVSLSRSSNCLMVSSMLEYLILVGVVNLIVLSFLFVIYKSPFGLALKSLRENERAGEALGKSAFWCFLQAFTLGSGLTATAGALYASYVTYIDPTSFSLNESIFQLAVLLLGGSGNIKGPLTGVLFMIILPEVLRFVGLPDTIAPNVRQIIYGGLLIVLMFLRPQGIAGEFEVR